MVSRWLLIFSRAAAVIAVGTAAAAVKTIGIICRLPSALAKLIQCAAQRGHWHRRPRMATLHRQKKALDLSLQGRASDASILQRPLHF